MLSALYSDDGDLVLDTSGAIIWYYHDPQFGGWAFPMRQLDNGDFLIANGASEIREVDLTGRIVRSLTLTDLATKLAQAGYALQPGAFHHDVLALPNGHWIVLVYDRKDFTDLPGYPGTTTVTGDALVDLDENNNPTWLWRAFDHLDVNRHPFQFPDWTHSNAIVFTPDGNLLLSVRHQSWILKIAYDNGYGNGTVLWRLGNEGDFTLLGGDKMQWFYTQHFPVVQSVNGSQILLGLFDNGDGRPDPNSPSGICFEYGTCYSRAAVYQVDESTMTAALTRQYAPGWFASWGGSITFLSNGDLELDSSQVNAGGSRILEVDPNGQVVWTMDVAGALLYRAYRIPSLYPGVQW